MGCAGGSEDEPGYDRRLLDAGDESDTVPSPGPPALGKPNGSHLRISLHILEKAGDKTTNFPTATHKESQAQRIKPALCGHTGNI